jgi:hypothetical protein
MSVKSDRHERLVAEEIDKINGIVATRPPASVHYSDVKVKRGNSTAWVEVKMNVTDNLINTRFSYDKNWSSTNTGEGATFLVSKLNKSQISKKFIKNLSEYIQIPESDIIIPTTKVSMNNKNAPSKEAFKKFFKEMGEYSFAGKKTQYIYKEFNLDVANVAIKHYGSGKEESADYIQIGDNFYRLSKSKNPLNLNNKVPLISGTGSLNVRVGFRSWGYEIQPEVKFDKSGLVESKYSLYPGTKKLNPFFAL